MSSNNNYPPIPPITAEDANNYKQFDDLNVDDKSLNANNSNELTTILKDKYTLSYSDYEKLKIAEQYNKIYLQSQKENEERNKLKINKRIYNMSISEIVKNASLVYMNVMNDIIIFMTNPAEKKDWNKFANIFVDSDNMIYIGLLLVLVSFSLWVIDVTQ